MPAPRQVEEQIARAREQQAASQPPAQQPPAGQSILDRALGQQQPAQAAQQPPQAAPQPTAQAAPQASPEAPQQDTYEQRYSSLQGMFANERAERERLERMVRELEASRTQQPAQSAPANDPFASFTFDISSLVSEEERNDIEPAVLSLMQRAVTEAAREGARAAYEHATKQIDQRVTPLQHTVRTRETNDVYSFLDEKVGVHWREQNKDPVFTHWLDTEYVPGTAMTYRQNLDMAMQSGKLDAVAATFKAWPLAHKAQPDGTQQPNGATPQGQSPLQTHYVTPSHGGFTPQQDGAKKQWTRAEVKTALDDAQKNRMPAEQFAALRAEISDAAREGRIIT